MSLAKATLVGAVHEVEEKTSQSGNKYLRMVVRTSEFNTSNSEFETVWHNNISVFGKLATKLLGKLKKGDIVYLEGPFNYYKYDTPNTEGRNKHAQWQMIANTVQIVGSVPKKEEEQKQEEDDGI